MKSLHASTSPLCMSAVPPELGQKPSTGDSPITTTAEASDASAVGSASTAKAICRDPEMRAIEALERTAIAEITGFNLALRASNEIKQAFEEAWTATRDDYVQFRGTIRLLFGDRECRARYNVHGTVAPQLREFVEQATLSYTLALDHGGLDIHGYDPSWLRAASTELQRLVKLDATAQTFWSQALEKEARRDKAVMDYVAAAEKYTNQPGVARVVVR